MATTDTTRGAAPLRAARKPAALRAMPDLGAPPVGADVERDAARAFGEALGRAGDRPGLDAVLRPAAEVLCGLLGADRCSVYLRGAEDGCLHGRLGFPASLDPVLRRLAFGVAEDPTVRDALRLRVPLALPDVPADPRPVQAVAVRRQHTGAVLVVPIAAGSRVLGALFVEDRDRRRRFGPDLEDAAAAFGALLGRWMDRSLRVAELAATRDALTRERRAHARITAVESAIAGVEGGPVRALVDAIAAATGDVLELRDATGALILRGVGGDDRPSPDAAACIAAARATTAAGPDGTALVPFRSSHPDDARFVVAPVRSAPEEDPRALFLLAPADRPDPTDRLIAARAASALAVRPAAGAEQGDDAAVLLLTGVLSGGLGTGVCDALALRLGVDAGTPRIVVLREDDGPSADDARTVLPDWSPVVVPVGEDAVLVLDVPADVERRQAADVVLERLRTVGGSGLVVSAPSAGLAGLPRALREARGAALVSGPGASLTVEALGPARLLASDPADAGALAHELLGPLLRPGSGGDDLARTMQEFFAAGASVTGTAGVLGLHANTIRHRFARIRERTGLDVLGDVGDQLVAQTAIIALRASVAAATGAEQVAHPSGA